MAHQLNLGLPVPLNQHQQLVYDILFAAAEAGEPCPSNTEIVHAANMGMCDSRVSDIVGQLDKLGMIRRHNATGGRRKVEIVSTGKTTSTSCNTTNTGARFDACALADAADSFARALKGQRFEDHPKAKPTTNPRFYPARHQAYGHEAMC